MSRPREAFRRQAAVRAVKVLSDALDKMGKGTDARIELELALVQPVPASGSAGCQPVTHAAASACFGATTQEAVRPFTAAATPVIPAVPTQAMAETQGSRSGARRGKGRCRRYASVGEVPSQRGCLSACRLQRRHRSPSEPEQLAEQEPRPKRRSMPPNRRFWELHLRLKSCTCSGSCTKPRRAGAPGELALAHGRR